MSQQTQRALLLRSIVSLFEQRVNDLYSSSTCRITP